MTRLADDGNMPADDAIARAANDVADGRPVDWAALGGQVQGSEALEQLECLRVIGAIADLHRSGEETTEQIDQATPLDSSHAPPENAGEPWGRYRLLRSVGAGTFGSVYLAWDPELEREVAIKILHRHLADAELTKRLLQEGRALAKVRHPNVVSVYGVESNEGRVGLVMEFVRGETLEKAMSGGHKLNPREAANVGQDICRALAAVHHAGFVHRDVTSRNIMRDLAGRIVLMDFGTGLQTAAGATPGLVKIAGTPMYMAPEVLAGQPASPSSDVYSVGVLLYNLVTGKYPVEGRTLDDLRAAHMVGRRTPLGERAPDLPIPFIQAVEHALAANPQQRCPSAGLLLQELAAVGSERRTTSSYVVLAVEIFAGVVVGVTALGAANSRYFNHTLGRLDFANESVIDWWNFGVSATIAPAIILTFALLTLGVLSVVTRLVLSVSSTARSLTTALVNVVRKSRLDDLTTLSSCVLLLSAAALVATWWYFSSFLSSLIAIGYISTAPSESLSFLSPRLSPYHYLYRKAFTAVFVGCLLLWYPVVRLAVRKGESINRSILAGGVAVLVLSLLLLDFPYRMILRGKKDFEAVRWSGDSCYILGERQAHLLLFCPDAETPRNRIVRNDDPNLQRLGIVQDIFTNVVPPK
jgi:serine/threonine-protein kinase